jgi:hypothetical protein
MKLRAQCKMISGKPRWYLVSSYRDEITKVPRTRHHLYLGVPPNTKIRKLIDRINESTHKYGKQFYTGAEFEQIKRKSLRLRENEKWNLRRSKAILQKKESQLNSAPERYQVRLLQRREIYALKKR